MRKLDEARELLYVIRSLDVLMSSGVGLEEALFTIGRGGYGVISEDFAEVMEKLNKGKSRGLPAEIQGLKKRAETDGYTRLLNTVYTNITQNTDILETLKKLGNRLEEERTTSMKDYQEALGSLPETLLSIGMIGPIILAVFGVIPQIVDASVVGAVGMTMPSPSVISSVLIGGLSLTLLGMAAIGYKAHSKDPGL
ncbi:MAG: type II secretion system F family protein [Candidatus Poseidoniaceae archaeon]